jgi:hypothetical protein
VACRPVPPRLLSGFLVWLLSMVPVAPTKDGEGFGDVQVSEH